MKLPIALALTVFALLFFAYHSFSSFSTSIAASNSVGHPKTFTLSEHGVSFVSSRDFKLTENKSLAVLQNKTGVIEIKTELVPYATLDDYLKSVKGTLDILSSEKERIAGNNVVVRMLNERTGEIARQFVLFQDSTAFLVTTVQPELYDDLDNLVSTWIFSPKNK